MSRLTIENIRRATDANGDSVSGAKRYIYEAGTTTSVSCFSDVALTVAQANPLTADSGGLFAETYLADGYYKVVIKDASDVILDEYDNVFIESAGASATSYSFNTVAEILADTILSYTAGSGLFVVAENDYVEAGGFRYIVRASGATTHIQTSNVTPVKLDQAPDGVGYHIDAFGAIGDGTTDDSTIATTFIEACRDDDVPGFGDYSKLYRLESLVSVTLADGASGVIDRVRLSGFRWLVANTTGGLRIGDGTTRQWVVELFDMEFEPALEASGYSFRIERSAGGLETDRHVRVDNVFIGVRDDNIRDRDFSNGYGITGCYSPLVSNLQLQSRGTSAGATKWSYVADFENTYRPQLTDCNHNIAGGEGSTYGYYCPGTTEEGFQLTKCVMNGADTGLYWVRTAAEPGMRITAGHFNSRVTNIYLDGVKAATFSEILMYTNLVEVGTDARDFHIVNADNISIVGMVGRTPGSGSDAKYHAYLDPRVGGICKHIHIGYSVMHADTNNTPPFYIAAGCENIEISLPMRASDFDNASYPDQLVTDNASADEVRVFSHEGPKSFQSGATRGPAWIIDRYSASPAAADEIGFLRLQGRNSTNNRIAYGEILAGIQDPTAGTERGYIDLDVQGAGSKVTGVRATSANNSGSTGLNIRVNVAGTPALYNVAMGPQIKDGGGDTMLVFDDAAGEAVSDLGKVFTGDTGTWTPVLADASSGGNEATFGTAQARYTKVGDVVFFSVSMNNINTIGLTAGNDIFIRGFPFTFATADIFVGSHVNCWMNGFTPASGDVIGFLPEPNQTYGRFRPWNSAAYENVSTLTSGSADIEINGFAFVD